MRDAFAGDLQFDQFVREQLAGDLLPWQDPEQRARQLVATGFLMLGPKMLSERDKAKLELDVADEQIDTFGKAFLGLTLGCARCHDHKFDPISSEDYYALAGVFCSTVTLEGEIQEFVSNWREQDLPIPAEQSAALATYQSQRKVLVEKIDDLEQRREKSQAKIDQISFINQGITVDNGEAELRGVWQASKQAAGFIGTEYLHDKNADKGQKSVAFTATFPESADYEVRISYSAAENRATNVPVDVLPSDGQPVRRFVDQTEPPPISGGFTSLGRFRFRAGSQLAVVIANENTDGYVIVDSVQFVSDVTSEAASDIGEGRAFAETIVALRDELQALQETSRTLKDELDQLDRSAPPPPPQVMAVRDEDAVSDIALRIRGAHSNPGAVVVRGFPRVLSGELSVLSEPERSGRRELAEWTVTSASPLLARVIVNRLWHHLLGAGIVRTVDNFGRQGERPSHPELLDYLAAELIAHDWSLKYLIRRIVLSETYQMRVQSNATAAARDPDNRWLWRANRKRLSSEQLRDALLNAMEHLDRRRGQSPVAHLGQLVNNNSAAAAGYERQSSYLRSFYLPIVRNELPDFLVGFDFADPDRVVGRRPETNVPAQALLLLNHPLMHEAADHLAASLAQSSDPESAVKLIYQHLFQRDPTERELELSLEFVQGASSTRPDRDAAIRNAWADLCHVLLASTEFRYLD